MEAESVPTFPSPSSTSSPLLNLQEKYNRLKRLTNSHLLYPGVESKIQSGIFNHFFGYHHFEKGLSIYKVIRDGGVLPTHYNFT